MTRHALLVRAAPAALAVAAAAVCWALAPASATPLLAAITGGVAVVAAATPRSAIATVTLLLLAGEFAAATTSTHGVPLLIAAVSAAITLWAVHQLFAFAAVVPADAVVEVSAVARLAARIAAGSAVTAPVAVLVLVIADVAPSNPGVRAAGVVAATAAALLPVYAVRRRDRAAVSAPK